MFQKIKNINKIKLFFINIFFIRFIEIYQILFSKDHWACQRTWFCKFTPSCSEYWREAFKKYFFLKALFKSILRIFRCNPWAKWWIDLP